MIQPSQDRTTFEIVRGLRPDPERQLPAARVSCTLRVGKDGKPHVLASYITLLGPSGEARDVATTRSFDDGLAVVDYAADGRPLGLEFLSGRGPAQLPELAAHVRTLGNELIRMAANQLRLEWIVSERVFSVLADVLTEATLERAFAEREPSSEMWGKELAFVA